jgi:hypothetical protein
VTNRLQVADDWELEEAWDGGRAGDRCCCCRRRRAERRSASAERERDKRRRRRRRRLSLLSISSDTKNSARVLDARSTISLTSSGSARSLPKKCSPPSLARVSTKSAVFKSSRRSSAPLQNAERADKRHNPPSPCRSRHPRLALQGAAGGGTERQREWRRSEERRKPMIRLLRRKSPSRAPANRSLSHTTTQQGERAGRLGTRLGPLGRVLAAPEARQRPATQCESLVPSHAIGGRRSEARDRPLDDPGKEVSRTTRTRPITTTA